ncbi:unnamed protein product [Lampetra fluviatilis]
MWTGGLANEQPTDFPPCQCARTLPNGYSFDFPTSTAARDWHGVIVPSTTVGHSHRQRQQQQQSVPRSREARGRLDVAQPGVTRPANWGPSNRHFGLAPCLNFCTSD